MLHSQYKLYLNNVWFETLETKDYYYDKRVFFATGARRFFTIYQILRTGDFTLTIVNEDNHEREIIKDAPGFKAWVNQHYQAFMTCLDTVDWPDHADSILK